MTDKGVFCNTNFADVKLTPHKSKGSKTIQFIPLRASSGIPLSMASLYLPSQSVPLSTFTGISYVVT